MALGYTMIPDQDKHIHTKEQIMAQMVVWLGGRVSEEIAFQHISTGAQDDIAKVSDRARYMVTQFGMSEKLGHLTYGKKHNNIFLGRDIHEEKNYSDETAMIIDQEVKCIVDECYATAKKRLLAHKDKLKLLADTLLEKEVMDDKEVRKLLGLKEEKKSGSSDKADKARA